MQSKNIDCVSFLLDRQPSLGRLSCNKDGRTPLQLAIFEGSPDMVSLMIQCSDIHAKDNEDHNCIHWATGEPRYGIIIFWPQEETARNSWGSDFKQLLC